MKKTLVAAASLALVLSASTALAAKKRGPPKPTPARAAENCKELQGDQLEACKVIGAYLDLWKQQKWAEVRKVIHPKTLEQIATKKKNIGVERDSMAPWYWAKETFLLTDWKLESVEDAAMGTVVIHTEEQSYRVEEDGMEEGEKNAYIAGKLGGKWYVVDRRSGGGGFDKTSIKVGMKGYFDPVAGEAEGEEAAK
ncbi:MAG TPA: hypothetical protein VGD74_06640 [Vulgatibacter sp.]